MQLTVPGGIDYEKIINARKYGITNNLKSFRSFEDEINSQFAVQATKPADRLSKRTGVLGYKIGMTHFWDKWGKLQPCTVIQLDRC